MKTALITGASGGIGSAVAKRLAADGISVMLMYNDAKEKALQVLAELSSMEIICDAVQCNVADSQSVNDAVARTIESFGHIDYLVNCAGISRRELLIDTTDEGWNEMLSVNLTGVFNTCRAVLPGMFERHSGKIVNISSIWGQVGASCETVYSATKAGVIGLTKALAKETAPSGITVNCVSPGCVDTLMMSDFSQDEIQELYDEIPLGRFARPEEVADTVAFLLSDSADYITGQNIGINGGFVI